MGYYWDNFCYHFKWVKKTKDGKLVCRAHPEVDLVYKNWTYYCPKCFFRKKKRDIHMYRTRPYRKFKPIKKGHKGDS